MVSRIVFIFVLLASLPFAALPLSAQARQIKLTAEPGTRVLRVGQKQTTFLKISLSGFEYEQDERTPVNVALVLDRSGSMLGEKLARAKEAALLAVDFLAEGDVVSVITYDSEADVILPATRVTNNRESIRRRIRSIHAGGNTALFAGVSLGAKEVRRYLSREKVNRVILLSDGLANVGPSSPWELGELGMSLGRETISVTTIGLGLGYNEDLMTQLAGYSDGNHAFAENASDLLDIFRNEFGDLMSIVAQEVDIHIHCPPYVKPLRVLGREAQINGRDIRTRMNQLSESSEKYILIEVEVEGGKSGESRELAQVDVSYLNLQSKQKDSLQQSVSISYSDSEDALQSGVDKGVMEAAVTQKSNAVSKEAVRLRDEGRIDEAKTLLQKNAEELRVKAAALASPALRGLSSQAFDDAAEIESEKDWNRKRKSLKEQQYKTDKQQSY